MPNESKTTRYTNEQRLAYLMGIGPDGLVGAPKDRYEYAIEVAHENGRDDPTSDDDLNGFVRMLDVGMRWDGVPEADAKVTRVKVEGFDVEGQAVPMTGPLLVFLPSMDPIAAQRIVALRDALPSGSVLVTGGEGARAELLSEVADAVLAEELRRRWGGNADTLTVKDIAEICVALEVDLTHKLLDDVLDTPLPMAAIRGFTVDEHKQVQAWAERFYDWAAIPTGENDAPEKPECLTRVLAFLEKGVIRVEPKPTDEAGIKAPGGMGATT